MLARYHHYMTKERTQIITEEGKSTKTKWYKNTSTLDKKNSFLRRAGESGVLNFKNYQRQEGFLQECVEQLLVGGSSGDNMEFKSRGSVGNLQHIFYQMGSKATDVPLKITNFLSAPIDALKEKYGRSCSDKVLIGNIYDLHAHNKWEWATKENKKYKPWKEEKFNKPLVLRNNFNCRDSIFNTPEGFKYIFKYEKIFRLQSGKSASEDLWNNEDEFDSTNYAPCRCKPNSKLNIQNNIKTEFDDRKRPGPKENYGLDNIPYTRCPNCIPPLLVNSINVPTLFWDQIRYCMYRGVHNWTKNLENTKYYQQQIDTYKIRKEVEEMKELLKKTKELEEMKELLKKTKELEEMKEVLKKTKE